ncbi:hypothetical protein [Paenibacillus albiflavus]|nr:hypothetical protein [Paenibacillus albiflavus]
MKRSTKAILFILGILLIFAASFIINEYFGMSKNGRLINDKYYQPLAFNSNIEDSLKIDAAKQVSGELTILLNKTTDKKVRLWFELKSLKDGRYLYPVSSGELFNDHVDPHKPQPLPFNLGTLEDGQYRIEFYLQSIQGKDESWGDLQIVYFHIQGQTLIKGLVRTPNQHSSEQFRLK